MKKLIKLSAFILLFTWLFVLNPYNTYATWETLDLKNWNAKVINVIDGDTIQVKQWTWTFTIRMIGIDAPELSRQRFWYKECESLMAKMHLENILKKEKYEILVRLDTKLKKDKYKRHLAYIYTRPTKIKKEKNINEVMLLDWMVYLLYDNNFQLNSKFKKSLEKAKAKEIWLWNDWFKSCRRKETAEEKEKMQKAEKKWESWLTRTY